MHTPKTVVTMVEIEFAPSTCDTGCIGGLSRVADMAAPCHW